LLGLQPYRDVAPPDAVARARVSAERAVALDDGLAEAHGTLAWLRHFYDWDWPGAEKEYRRALELNPGYATGHMRYAVYLADVGRGAHPDRVTSSRRPVLGDRDRAPGWRPVAPVRGGRRRTAVARDRSGQPSSGLILCWTFWRAQPRKALAVFGLRRPRRNGADPVDDRDCPQPGRRPRARRRGEAALLSAGVGRRSPPAPCRHRRRQQPSRRSKAIADRLEIVTGLKVDPLFDSLRADPGSTACRPGSVYPDLVGATLLPRHTLESLTPLSPVTKIQPTGLADSHKRRASSGAFPGTEPMGST
jgi:hypothetical protein